MRNEKGYTRNPRRRRCRTRGARRGRGDPARFPTQGGPQPGKEKQNYKGSINQKKPTIVPS